MLQFDEEVIAWTCKIAYKIFLKDQKILKNQMVHYLEIIETKQNIYD